MIRPMGFRSFFGVILLLIGFLFLFGFTSASFAAIPVAQVVWVKGDVQAIAPDTKARSLKRSDFIYEHDTIKTAASSGQVVFTDSSLLSLKENSEFKIDEYKYDKKGPAEKNKFVGELVKGGFRQLTGAITKDKPENYKVNTPVATIGVRGSGVAANLNGKDLQVNAFEGHVFVETPKGKAELNASTLSFASVNGAGAMPVTSVSPPPSFSAAPVLEKVNPSPELIKASVAVATPAPAVAPVVNPASTGPASASPAPAAPASTTESAPAASSSPSSSGGGGGGACGIDIH